MINHCFLNEIKIIRTGNEKKVGSIIVKLSTLLKRVFTKLKQLTNSDLGFPYRWYIQKYWLHKTKKSHRIYFYISI